MKRLLVRQEAGLGDALMVVAAAKSIWIRHKIRVHLLTDPDFVPLFQCSPYIQVTPSDQHHDRADFAPLDCSIHALKPTHMVDSYLESLGYPDPDPSNKTLDLCIPDRDHQAASRIVQELRKPLCVVHASAGNPNRTWSQWQALADLLVQDGWEVINVGQRYTHKTVFALDGVVDRVNQLSLLETVALMRLADLVICTDSGPLHLAGATETPLIGIFSSVLGEHRMPFRPGCVQHVIQAPCPMSGCFSYMNDPEMFQKHRKPGDYYGKWCPAESGYGCLKSLTADTVMEQVRTVWKSKKVKRKKPQ